MNLLTLWIALVSNFDQIHHVWICLRLSTETYQTHPLSSSLSLPATNPLNFEHVLTQHIMQHCSFPTRWGKGCGHWRGAVPGHTWWRTVLCISDRHRWLLLVLSLIPPSDVTRLSLETFILIPIQDNQIMQVYYMIYRIIYINLQIFVGALVVTGDQLVIFLQLYPTTEEWRLTPLQLVTCLKR